MRPLPEVDSDAPVRDGSVDAAAVDSTSRRSGGRHWRRAVVALAAVGIIGAGLVVARPVPPGLHELGPVGIGDADGRDMARTGETGLAPLARPDGIAWRQESTFVVRGPETWVQLTPDHVLQHDGNEIVVLDRSTGQRLWEVMGGWLVDTPDLAYVVVSGLDGTDRLQARRWDDGEVLWERRFRGSLRPVDTGPGWFLVGEGDGPASTLQLLDAQTGRERWRTGGVGAAAYGWAAGATSERVLVATEEWNDRVNDWQPRYVLHDLADGAVLWRSDDHVPPGTPARQVTAALRPDGHVLFGTSQRLVSLDPLRPGEAVVDVSDLLSGSTIGVEVWIDARGGLAAVRNEAAGTTGLLDLATLEVRWEVDQPEQWLDLWGHSRHGGDRILVRGGWATTQVRDVRTGEVLLEDRTPLAEATYAFDAFGTVRAVGPSAIHHRSHDGDQEWTVGTAGTGRLRAVEGSILFDTSDGLVIRDSATGDEEFLRNESTVPGLVVAAGLVVEVSTSQLQANDPRQQEIVWRRRLESAPTAALATDTTVVVATAEVIRRLDALDGDVVDQRGVVGTWSLSMAGADTEAVLVALSRDPECIGSGCPTTVWMFTADGLEQRWESDPLVGACAGATLAGRHVAIPTVDGMAFLDAGTGQVAGSWELAGHGCHDAAWTDHDGGSFLLATPGALVLGRPDGIRRRIEVEHSLVGSPQLRGTQALVAAADGVVAVDLVSGSTSWHVPLPLGVSAGPVAVGDALVVALTDRSLVRLD